MSVSMVAAKNLHHGVHPQYNDIVSHLNCTHISHSSLGKGSQVFRIRPKKPQ